MLVGGGVALLFFYGATSTGALSQRPSAAASADATPTERRGFGDPIRRADGLRHQAAQHPRPETSEHFDHGGGATDAARAVYQAQLDDIEDRLEEDPVAQVVPSLFDVPPEKQLATLHWMKELPRDKLVSAIPSVGAEAGTPAERAALAVVVVDDLIRGLEQQKRGAP